LSATNSDTQKLLQLCIFIQKGYHILLIKPKAFHGKKFIRFMGPSHPAETSSDDREIEWRFGKGDRWG
jgi:hypothetical protein